MPLVHHLHKLPQKALPAFFLLIAIILPAAVFAESLPKVVMNDTGASTGLPDLFTGTMSYAIPVDVPPGRRGMDPGIALNYRSGKENGLLGIGWDLDLGSIQRPISANNTVSYTDNNFLFVKAGTVSTLVYNAVTDSYQAKIENDFSRIRKLAATDNRSYWEVTDKSGMRFSYGMTAASRQDDASGNSIYRWALDRIEDTNGNYIAIYYTKNQGQIYLDRIEYTGSNSGLLPTNVINFYWGERTDASTVSTTGFPVTTAYRLITVKSSNIYNLTYQYSPLTTNSLLSSVVTSDSALDTPPCTTFGMNSSTTCCPIGSKCLAKPVVDNSLPTITLQYVQQQGATADYLTSIKTFAGGTTSIAYDTATLSGTTDTVSNVKSVSINDGNGNVATTYYHYSDGYYYAPEKEFRGFNKVDVWGPVSDGKQIRTTTYFHQGNDTEIGVNNPNVATGYMKGKPYRAQSWGLSGVTDGSANITLDQSTLISEITTSYQSLSNSTYPSYFTPPLQVDSYSYDAGAVGSHTKAVFPAYDGYGNITREEHYGDVNDSSNKQLNMTVVREYQPNTTDWIVGLPATETVYKGIGTASGDKIRQTGYYYDDYTDCYSTGSTRQNPSKGNVTRIARWLSDGINPESFPDVRIAYDIYGNPTCRRDPNGKVTATDFDAASKTFPLTVTNPKSHTTTYSYYGVNGVTADKGLYGQLKSVQDANNNSTTFEYDWLGRKIKTIQPANFWSSIAYNSFGTVGSQHVYSTNSLGAWSASYFDGLGRTIKSRRSGSENKAIASDTVYDTLGRLSSISAPYFEGSTAIDIRTYAYDVLGRAVSVTNPDTTSIMACYSSLVTDRIDENRHKRRETRDQLGRLVRIDEFTGSYQTCDTTQGTIYSTTNYSYDVLGSLATVAVDVSKPGDPPNIKTTTINYDTLGRKQNMTDPDMGLWKYGYYSNGSLFSVTDANNQTITYDIDELNRVLAKHYPSGSGATDVTYTYDEATSSNPKGQLTSMIDGSGSTTYHYNTMGLINKTVKRVKTSDTTYTDYNISKAYDGLGRITSLTYPNNETIGYRYDSGGNLQEITGYAEFDEYNALGQPGKLYQGNGIVTSYWYTPKNNRLMAIKAVNLQTPILYKTYNYDNKGNITAINDLASPAIPQSAESGSIGYTYWPDKANALQGISSRPLSVFTYDNNGNLKNDGIRTINYTPDNMPKDITASGATTSFTYDGNGRRIMKVSANGTRVYLGKLHECLNGNCGNYIYAGNTRIARSAASGDVYYHGDHLGSTGIVTDDTGNNIEAIAYYPFGETRQDSGSIDMIHKYTAQEQDGETGLYNYNARLYDPEIGRFITADSLVPDPGNAQSLNRYSYALNNPVLYVDPTGHFRISISLHVGIGFDLSYDTHGNHLRAGAGYGAGGGISVGEGKWDVGASSEWYVDAGYDNKLGSYATGRYGVGVTAPGMQLGAGASGTYYLNSGRFQVGAGAGLGFIGVNAGYSSFGNGSWSLGGSFAGVGGTYDFGSKSWRYSVDTNAAEEFYNQTVHYPAVWSSGGDAVEKTRYEYPKEGSNNIGTQGEKSDPNGWFNEGGHISRALNVIPGVNAVAGLHDVFQINLDIVGGNTVRNVLNVPGMIPAAVITTGALMNGFIRPLYNQ